MSEICPACEREVFQICSSEFKCSNFKARLGNTASAGGTASGTSAPRVPTKGRLPETAEARKNVPLCRGVFDYFPDALAAVAALSKRGNDQHNPGQEMHWARGKSTDHADCILRHLMDRGLIDTDGIPHSVKVAWRALALAQEEIEKLQDLPLSRGSRGT